MSRAAPPGWQEQNLVVPSASGLGVRFAHLGKGWTRFVLRCDWPTPAGPPPEPENDSPLIDREVSVTVTAPQFHPTLPRHERPLEPCWREGGCLRHHSTVQYKTSVAPSLPGNNPCAQPLSCLSPCELSSTSNERTSHPRVQGVLENHDNRFFACHLDCKVKERKYVVSLGEFSVLFLEFFFF